jgi:hypothetical protein
MTAPPPTDTVTPRREMEGRGMSITSVSGGGAPGDGGGESPDRHRLLGGRPSPQIGAVALAGAISTTLWTLLAAFVTTGLSTQAIATLTGATTTIVAFVLGYLIPD